MSDLIDRQAATDALSNGALVNYQNAGHNNGLVKAIDVIKGLPSVQQWIPCSERLPEVNREVLVCTNEKDIFVAKRYKPWDYEWYETVEYRRLLTVTAWMPLPEPYKQEENR